jgi:hypothetical protein
MDPVIHVGAIISNDTKFIEFTVTGCPTVTVTDNPVSARPGPVRSARALSLVSKGSHFRLSEIAILRYAAHRGSVWNAEMVTISKSASRVRVTPDSRVQSDYCYEILKHFKL